MGPNLTLNRRDHKTYTLAFKDENGDYIDISGWSIFFTAKTNKLDTDDEAKIRKDVDVSSGQGPTGRVSFTLTPSETDIEAGTLYYDIQIKKPDGTILTPLIGLLSIVQDVTIRTS
jgi:hypothetical protein